MNDNFQLWLHCALVRAVRTFLQALAGVIFAYSFLSEVDLLRAFLAACFSAVFSLCMSAGGLPEVGENNDISGRDLSNSQ